MGDVTGFLKYGRQLPPAGRSRCASATGRRSTSPSRRSRPGSRGPGAWTAASPSATRGARSGNLIPEWNDLVYRDEWAEAVERLHATNNFPEFTGRLCPAPCEGACVLGINDDPVTIERIEYEIIERAWAEGWVVPVRPAAPTGKRVAVVGSGPAGLAAAQQLARAGHQVVVFERAEKPGGLLRYGIPEFKMEKAVLDRRLAQMEAEGRRVPVPRLGGGAAPEVRRAWPPTSPWSAPARWSTSSTACCWPAGPPCPVTSPVPGRELGGIHLAMDYLKPSNLVQEGPLDSSPISAEGKHVVIIGGGDTGADCLGTVHRQRALSVHQLEIMPEPPSDRSERQPVADLAAHPADLVGPRGRWRAGLLGDHVGVPGRRRRPCPGPAGRGGRGGLGADGRPEFVPVEGSRVRAALRAGAAGHGVPRFGADRAGGRARARGRRPGERGRRPSWSTNVEGVFVCGDMTRGQSLIVWAIAEGRSAAASVDRFLMGRTDLPAPIEPGQMALR